MLARAACLPPLAANNCASSNDTGKSSKSVVKIVLVMMAPASFNGCINRLTTRKMIVARETLKQKLMLKMVRNIQAASF